MLDKPVSQKAVYLGIAVGLVLGLSVAAIYYDNHVFEYSMPEISTPQENASNFIVTPEARMFDWQENAFSGALPA